MPCGRLSLSSPSPTSSYGHSFIRPPPPYTSSYDFGSISCLLCQLISLEMKTGHEDRACNVFNGTRVRYFRGPLYTNIACPTMPE
uniref:Uncharacterized protein n=1 Tax=Zea mays TaxID=4577 RepID=A0A804MEZ2_MAIZE